MNVKSERFNIKFIPKYGHLSYTIHCPKCGYESEHQCGEYPKIVTCPYCKYHIQIKIITGKEE